MADNIGLNSFISVETEATYGTDPASSPTYLRIVSETIKRLSDQTAGCRGLGRATPAAIRNFRRRSAGDLTFHAEYEGMEKLLLHFFGGTDVFTVDTPVVGAHTHKFAPSTTRQVGMSVHVNKDTIRDLFVGEKLQSLRMGITQDNIEFGFGLIGLPGTNDSSPDTPTYPSAPCVVPIEGTNGVSVLVDTVARTIKSADVSLDWPHTEDRDQLGDATMKKTLVNDFLTMGGTITRDLETNDFITEWLTDAFHVLEFNYKSDDFITGTTEYELKIKFYRVSWTEQGANADGPSAIPEEIGFVAFPDASGNIMDITIINGIGAAVT